ncbi:MAG: hypothetical protein ACRCZ3_16270 [Providencia rustigianii]|uniref:hypothetical protein n=1 Tax=Providencia rustigianii TaxID=158850 RepID=UPI003F384FBF
MKRICFLFFLFFSFKSMADCGHIISNSSYSQYVKEFKSLKKTNFYVSPVVNAKLNNLFIIKGDLFTSYLTNDEFVYGNYENSNGVIFSGWIKKEDLITEDDKIKNKAINFNDFVFYTSFKKIKLGTGYQDFYKDWAKCEINIQQDQYVGISGNFQEVEGGYYKYFEHYWDGLYIKTSNINREELKNDFDWYRITEINITNDNYMTNRGVYVGMKENEIVNAYGDCHKKNSNLCSYIYKNNKLIFHVSNGVITSIDMEELPL